MIRGVNFLMIFAPNNKPLVRAVVIAELLIVVDKGEGATVTTRGKGIRKEGMDAQAATMERKPKQNKKKEKRKKWF